VHRCFRVAPRDELADLTPELPHRLEQALVRLAELAGEELHHADHPSRAEQWEAEGGMQPVASSDVCAWEVPVLWGVDDPDGLARGEYPAGKPVPRRERDPLAERLEFGGTVSGMPDAAAAQALVVWPDLPHRTELPAERAADGLQSRRVSLDRPIGFREDPGDRVLNALEVEGVSKPSACPTAGHTQCLPPCDRFRHSIREPVNDKRPLRIVIADDNALLREGIASLLRDAGHEVVGRSGSADDLLLKVRSYSPDIAIVDVRMPPGNADDGLVAAAEIRRLHPGTAVLVLSQHLEPFYMLELVGDTASGVGYLLKDRVRDVPEFLDAVERVASGGTAFDPQVVKSLVDSHRRSSLDELTDRERTVLALIAEGRSNRAIAKDLYLSSRAVERHVQGIFEKLRLPATEDDNRRVLAVLALLGG
jgi:DNA-binding NarL/FixJ family response regulator